MRGLGLAIALSVSSSGCLGGSLIDARVNEARDAEGALDSLHDYEIARAGAEARVVDLEGLYAASGGDSRAALLLARAWVKLTFEFTSDDYELALESGDVADESYQLARTQAGFRRGVFYADVWLERRAPGFATALTDQRALPAWLSQNLRDADAAEALLWAGMGRIGVAGASAVPGEEQVRRIGEVLSKHSLALSPGAGSGLAHLGLALGAGRNAIETATVERELSLAESAAPGRLLVPLMRARTLFCQRHDRRSFERELERVLRQGDPEPALRLENVVAKRRARRYLTSRVIDAACFASKPASQGLSPAPR